MGDPMQAAIMIRVTPEDYAMWIKEHDGCREARKDYGMTDGPVYRDANDASSWLVHLNCENIERAKSWFADERFKAAAQRAGNVRREIFFAQPKPV